MPIFIQVSKMDKKCDFHLFLNGSLPIGWNILYPQKTLKLMIATHLVISNGEKSLRRRREEETCYWLQPRYIL